MEPPRRAAYRLAAGDVRGFIEDAKIFLLLSEGQADGCDMTTLLPDPSKSTS